LYQGLIRDKKIEDKGQYKMYCESSPEDDDFNKGDDVSMITSRSRATSKSVTQKN